MDYMIFSGPALLAVGGAVSIFYAFRNWKTKQMIDNIPRSKIRSMAMGLVEVQGKASGEKTLVAPFSGKKCFFYEYRVEKLVRDHKTGKTHYKTVSKGQDSVPFFIDDGTGRVHVKTDGAKYYVGITTDMKSHAGNIPSERIKKFLDSIGVAHEGLLASKNLRFVESLIIPGGMTYVMGSAMHSHQSKDTKSDSKPVAKSVSDRVIIAKGENDPFFFIGNEPEESITRYFFFRILGFGIIGALIFFLGIFMALGISAGQ